VPLVAWPIMCDASCTYLHASLGIRQAKQSTPFAAALQQTSRQVRTCVGKLLPVLKFAAGQHRRSELLVSCCMPNHVQCYMHVNLLRKAISCVAVHQERYVGSRSAGPMYLKCRWLLHNTNSSAIFCWWLSIVLMLD